MSASTAAVFRILNYSLNEDGSSQASWDVREKVATVLPCGEKLFAPVGWMLTNRRSRAYVLCSGS